MSLKKLTLTVDLNTGYPYPLSIQCRWINNENVLIPIPDSIRNIANAAGAAGVVFVSGNFESAEVVTTDFPYSLYYQSPTGWRPLSELASIGGLSGADVPDSTVVTFHGLKLGIQ